MTLPPLPPLNALHVFAVAGRQMSFKGAAELLRVSPGAVSQQIKLLEAHLGCALFVRRNRSIDLTEEGTRLLAPLRDAFQAMSDAVEQIAAPRAPHVLTVSVLPSFAALWLISRLGKFRLKHPGIEILFNATTRLVTLGHEHVDIGIRSGLGRYAGLHVDKLFSAEVYPVCHPRLVTGRYPLRTPGDLKHHPLLHDSGQNSWAQWLKAQGVPETLARRGPVFSDANLILQAALNGLGVALLSTVLTEAALTRGDLVRPFAASLSRNLAYYVVCESGRELEPAIRAFREWIVTEAQQAACDADAAQPGAPAAPVKHRKIVRHPPTQRRSRHARAS